MEENDLLRRRLLAGIITESQYESNSSLLSEQKKSKEEESSNDSLTSKEEEILQDILADNYSLSEAANFSNVLDKFKSYLKKGLITTALLSSILASPALAQSEKEQIKKEYDKTIGFETPGDDMLSKFHKLMASHAPKDGEFKKISSEPHGGSFEKTTNDFDIDTVFSYKNEDELNPNVDLDDVAENLDSKVIQQKYNWIIKNMSNIQANNQDEFDAKFESIKEGFKTRFANSEMDEKEIGGNKIIVFDHIFKQDDGYAQGPKSYKTSDGKIIEVGERIPKNSHVIDFYAGKIKPIERVGVKKIKDTVDLVQIKMKPITITPGVRNYEQAKDDFKKIFSKYGDVKSTGSHIVLTPTFMGVVEKDKADEEISRLNDEIKKLGDKHGFDFNGKVFSKAGL